MMKARSAVLTPLVVLLLAGTACNSKGAAPEPPPADGASALPADFSNPVDNPYIPLAPGTTSVFRSFKEGRHGIETFSVLNRSETIRGVPCAVVRDVLKVGGSVTEMALHYYAPDSDGNIWTFGEDVLERNRQGELEDTGQSWRAGIAGAEPGIFMTAVPEVGTPYRQEYISPGREDYFAVIETKATVSVPYGRFTDALLTREANPLEPHVLDHKYYVKGIGEVAESSVKGPPERLVLIDFRRS